MLKIKSPKLVVIYMAAGVLLLLVLLAGVILFINRSWLFGGQVTYPKSVLLDEDISGLDTEQISSRLDQIKTVFEGRDITLRYNDESWIFVVKDVGVSFNASATGQVISQSKAAGFWRRFSSLLKREVKNYQPVIEVDEEICVAALSAISIPDVEPKDAAITYDQGLKIEPDQPSSKFSAATTCRELPARLAENQFDGDVSFEIVDANITEADLETELPAITNMAGQPLVLEGNNYQLALSEQQLLDMIEITKNDGKLGVAWSDAKLDELISGVASKVNVYNGRPAVSGCQYVVSVGGNFLNGSAVKDIFNNLKSDGEHTYGLPMVRSGPVIRNYSPVTPGNKGVVYLTFDDGMALGNQIMNLATCFGVKVTFFEIGELANRDAASLRRAINEGHSVQSHAYIHAMYDYGDRSYDWQYDDIRKSIEVITEVTGVRPTYFRPPGGNRSANTYLAAQANDIKLILWGVTGADTFYLDSGTICNNVLKGVFPGASVLMHSTKSATVAALPCIIEGLAAKGYSMQALR